VAQSITYLEWNCDALFGERAGMRTNATSGGRTTSAAGGIAKMVPNAHVAKDFNTVFAQIYASRNPRIQGKSISIFVAGDNNEAKEKVQRLITAMGFDVVNAGPLKSATNIEPLAMLNISLGYGQGLGTSMGFSLLR
jgi:8-hydroxy-5-deazaflavin:NADPH oxidoreductase